MRFLPFDDFEIHTAMSSNEVFYRLRAAVDTERKWWIFTNKLFWGEVNRYHFKIWRDTWWNRNFTPIVSGTIQSKNSGCYLQIRMRMHWFSLSFYMLILGWLWILYFGSIANLIVQRIQSGIWQIDSPWLLLPSLGMFAFIYLISVGTFRSEVRIIKDYFLSLLQADKESIICQNQIFGLTESQFIKSLFLLTLVISLAWIGFSLFQPYFLP